MSQSFRDVIKPVIVYGPQGCGKSRSAAELMERFGTSVLVDEWDGRQALPESALVLTNVRPPYPQPGTALDFKDCGCA